MSTSFEPPPDHTARRSWSRIDSGVAREVHNRFRHQPWGLARILELLDVHDRRSIVDIGCGGGYFTRKLAKAARPDAAIVGIDSDPEMIRDAMAIDAQLGIAGRIDWRVGEVNSLPLSDGSFELVVCHTLLCNLPALGRPLSELARVAKPEGTVAAVEPAHLEAAFEPVKPPELAQLERKLDTVFRSHCVPSLQDPAPVDPEEAEPLSLSRAMRYPGLFRRAGLEEIAMDGDASVFLATDPRHDRAELASYFRDWAALVDREKERWRELDVIHGGQSPDGLSNEEFDRYIELKRGYYLEMANAVVDGRAPDMVTLRVDVVVWGRRPKVLREMQGRAPEGARRGDDGAS